MTKSRGINAPRHRWTAEQLHTLQRDYPHAVTRELAAHLGVPVYLVYAKAGCRSMTRPASCCCGGIWTTGGAFH